MRYPFGTVVVISYIGLTCFPALAQGISVKDGAVPFAQGISVSVLREASLIANPGYCCCNPQRLECRTEYETVPPLAPGQMLGVDPPGSIYQTADYSSPLPLPNGQGATVQKTALDSTTTDLFGLYRCMGSDQNCDGVHESFDYLAPFYFDATNGRMSILTRVRLIDSTGRAIDDVVGIMQITGLPTMFDTLLTFVPTGQTISLLTPAFPDGFRSADSLQAWSGDVRALPDWSQATPLACTAATAPTPGQLVTVADTLPDPPVGQVRYYITASQSGTQRRLGREYVNGAFAARDPIGLPACQ